jgi:polar amino acid transport system substrate-binding protein
MRLLIILLTICSGSLLAETIKVANGEFPPYTSKNLKHYGIYSKIVEEAFKLEGYKLKHSFYPWTRAYKHVKFGIDDISLTWIKTEERAKDVEFSSPVTMNEKVLFHLKSKDIKWDKISDLKKYKMAVTKDYTYGEDIDLWVSTKQNNVFVVSEDKLKFNMLVFGRIDAFPMEKEVGYYLAKKLLSPEKFKMITHHKKPILEEGMSVIFSKQIPQKRRDKIKKAFERGLKTLKDSGKVDKYFWELRNGSLFEEI